MPISLKNALPTKSLRRWIASGFYHDGVFFLMPLIRSYLLNYRLTRSFYPLVLRLERGVSLKAVVTRSSIIKMSGVLSVKKWGGECAASSITVGAGATFELMGDFTIGPGVHISIEPGGVLSLGGAKMESESGVTANSRIMVKERVEIGRDAIVSWGVLVTDSDWHHISWGDPCKPVKIGDKVWISHDVSILKGAYVGDGCVVGAKSLVANISIPSESLVAGVPAKVVRNGISWSR